MNASGFTNAPLTKYLLIALVASSILVSATDTKYYFDLSIPALLKNPHRLPLPPLAITNSTELLFTALTLYALRAIERLWGSRKLLSFVLVASVYTTTLPALLLALLASVLPASLAASVFVPAGPTALVFALLAQWHAAIPFAYKYQIAEGGVTLTSKSVGYLLPAQLALAQLPSSAVCAGVGWVVGYMWRGEVLPGAGWRVPKGWIRGL